MIWTDEIVDELKRLWKKGMTTTEIAKKLGVSKNSVVGKVHRIGLSSRPSPIKIKPDGTQESALTCSNDENKTNAVENTARPSDIETFSETDAIAVTEDCNEDISQSCSSLVTKLTDLDSHTCRWPIGDPKDEDFHFCGKKIKTGQTYCEEHSAIAYVRR